MKMRVLMERMAEASADEPRAGTVFSVVLSMISMAVLAICMTRRVQNVQDWSRYPLVCWLFVLGSAVVSAGFRVNYSQYMCSNAIILCLSCYMTTKVSIEIKESDSLVSCLNWAINFQHDLQPAVVRLLHCKRPQHSLKPAGCKFALTFFTRTFTKITVHHSSIVKTAHQRSALPLQLDWNAKFQSRFANYENGECRIGMKQVAMIPLIAFDILVNVYLTFLFLVPLQGLYSYKNNPNSQTRTVALRTFIGSCCALTSSVVNLTLLLVLKGEPGWVCLMCCNLDILFSVLVLHWITSKDNASTFLPRRSYSHAHSHTCSYPTIRTSALPSPISPYPLISSPRSIPENMGFSNRDHLFTSTNGVNGAKPDGYSYARDAIDLPTVTTTVTAGVGVGEILNEEEKKKNRGLENGNRNGEIGIRKPKMAITVERDHVREVVETGIRIVNDRDHERLILTLPRSISGGGGSIGIEIEIGDGEKEGREGRRGEEDGMDISF
ncbi:uncharacterized protein EAE97_006516 [Botrytis byssoidea]|uniref:Uncharacterized protein n=1 Tax=Botrytis byssoidea TaxID=139641 RepID=A0A9P5INL7_9HELO|nr:uncharacterized protein EAE97_006516 [Botrytis byssoidea]KAF7941679.1 hypothetical protein EAE97_006516 [Botrytis byssoidea]